MVKKKIYTNKEENIENKNLAELVLIEFKMLLQNYNNVCLFVSAKKDGEIRGTKL